MGNAVEFHVPGRSESDIRGGLCRMVYGLCWRGNYGRGDECKSKRCRYSPSSCMLSGLRPIIDVDAASVHRSRTFGRIDRTDCYHLGCCRYCHPTDSVRSLESLELKKGIKRELPRPFLPRGIVSQKPPQSRRTPISPNFSKLPLAGLIPLKMKLSITAVLMALAAAVSAAPVSD